VRFIAEDLEMVPQLVCLRSGQDGVAEMLRHELADLALDPQVIHGTDVYRAKRALAEVRPEMVLGSNIERHAVRDIPYVFRLVNPISKFRLTDRAYWGYVGMLNLIETMQNDWWDRYRSKRRRYKARW
jgi:nitrogenase molybdenum-iron protein alpha/beta subunit